MPRVSVIMPSYNQADFICESIRSIFGQTYGDYEIVVVDSSTDGTGRALEPYMDRIRYFRQERLGPGAARNLAIEESRGELVAFLDSDDIWLPGKLETQVSFIDDHPGTDLVHSDYIRMDPGGMVIGTSILSNREPPYSLEDIIGFNAIGTLTVMARRERVLDSGCFDEELPVAEDFDLWTRMLMDGCSFGFIPEVLARWRRHPGSISLSRVKIHTSHIRTIEKVRSRLDGSADRGLVKLAGARFRRERLCLAAAHLEVGDVNRARAMTRRLVSERPTDHRAWLLLGKAHLPRTGSMPPNRDFQGEVPEIG